LAGYFFHFSFFFCLFALHSNEQGGQAVIHSSSHSGQ